MANPKHVALVRKGAEAIDAWRREHPRAVLNLSEANLGGVNLSAADLWGANLTGAKLTGAKLVKADFGLACAINADLAGANLTGADLDVTLLSGADLSGADLTQAKLSWADLSGANLARTKLGFTALEGLNLSGAKGLTDVVHQFPSTVGVDTLIASFRGGGNKLTPELRTFFRGAGVPPELLDALPGIVAEVKYYSCFISYGQPDMEFAKKLCQDLEAKGVSCWLYEMDKTPGERTWSEIGARRREADKVVVLCSAAALVRPGVRKEIEEQIDEDADKLVPISLDHLWTQPGFLVVRDGRDLKPFLMERNRPDFSGWEADPERYDQALELLLKGLRRPKVKKARQSKKPS
jgi:hypothetical protein